MSNNEIRFKDSDLREALRRKYANTPTLPAGFKERIMKGIQKDWNMKTIRLGESITVLAAAIYLTGCTAQNSRWDRYLGMTAAMTQVPVPSMLQTK